MSVAAADPRPVDPHPGIAGRRPSRSGKVGYAIAGVLAGLVFVIPLLWAVLRSLQTSDVITAAPGAKSFTDLTLQNFSGLLSSRGLLRNVLNSLVVSIGTGVLVAIVATLAGYGLAKYRFRGRTFAFGLIVFTLMIPFQTVLTPLFIELNTIGLTNSLIGLILFYTTFNLPFGVFVMRNAFALAPSELEDAARVDGASTLQVLTRVLRPLVAPGIATVVLYAFLASWTEFLGALTIITDTDKTTLPVALFNVQTGNAFGQINFGFLMAGSVVAMIPCVVLFVSLQRYYVAGLASGAVKG